MPRRPRAPTRWMVLIILLKAFPRMRRKDLQNALIPFSLATRRLLGSSQICMVGWLLGSFLTSSILQEWYVSSTKSPVRYLTNLKGCCQQGNSTFEPNPGETGCQRFWCQLEDRGSFPQTKCKGQVPTRLPGFIPWMVPAST